MLGIITTLLGGSVTGILGNVLNGVFDFFKEKKRMENDVALKRLDIEMMQAENAMHIQREQIVQEGQIVQAEIIAGQESRTAAYQYDKRSFSEGLIEAWQPHGWFSRALRGFLIFLLVTVDLMRGYTRPLVTWFTCVITAYLSYYVLNLWDAKGGFQNLDQEKAYALVEYIIYFTFYITSMVLSFWFCERNRVKAPAQKGS